MMLREEEESAVMLVRRECCKGLEKKVIISFICIDELKIKKIITKLPVRLPANK